MRILNKLPILFLFLIKIQNTYAGEEEEGVDFIYLLHRYTGYSILAGGVSNVMLGYYVFNLYKNGERVPDTLRYAHGALGYGIAGLSVLQSVLGYITFWEFSKEEGMQRRRVIHAVLSTAATAGFISTVFLARDAREEIESGRASGGVADSFYPHLIGGLFSVSLVITAVIVIAW